MPSTCDVSDVNSGYLANVETSEQTSRSFISYSHRRVDSGDIVGAGYQFRSPRPQNSWPRHIEIASEDLEPQCSAAGNLAVEVTSIPQPGPRRSGTSRNDMDSAPSIKSQVYTEADVAEFVAQRDGSQYGASGATRSGKPPLLLYRLYRLLCTSVCIAVQNVLVSNSVENQSTICRTALIVHLY
jgi:hypothetical protein